MLFISQIATFIDGLLPTCKLLISLLSIYFYFLS